MKKKYLFRIISCIFAVALLMVQGSAFAQGVVNEVIAIDSLNGQTVVINKTKFINIGDVDYKIDEPVVISFENSDEGRAALEANIPEPFLSAVMAVWNDLPAVAFASKVSKTSISQVEKIQKLESVSESETLAVNEVVSIDFLDNKYAAFLKNNYITVDGIDYKLGNPWAVSYENSERGRRLITEDENIPENLVLAVMAVWGDTPTVVFPPEIENPNLN